MREDTKHVRDKLGALLAFTGNGKGDTPEADTAMVAAMAAVVMAGLDMLADMAESQRKIAKGIEDITHELEQTRTFGVPMLIPQR